MRIFGFAFFAFLLSIFLTQGANAHGAHHREGNHAQAVESIPFPAKFSKTKGVFATGAPEQPSLVTKPGGTPGDRGRGFSASGLHSGGSNNPGCAYGCSQNACGVCCASLVHETAGIPFTVNAGPSYPVLFSTSPIANTGGPDTPPPRS